MSQLCIYVIPQIVSVKRLSNHIASCVSDIDIAPPLRRKMPFLGTLLSSQHIRMTVAGDVKMVVFASRGEQ